MLLPRQRKVGGQQREPRLHYRPGNRDRLLQGRGMIPMVDIVLDYIVHFRRAKIIDWSYPLGNET